MKKATAVILSILLIFSIFTCVAFAENSELPTPDEIIYIEPTYPPAQKTDLSGFVNSVFGFLTADQNGPFAQFISAMRSFFEQAINFLQPIIENFAGTDASALQGFIRKFAEL